MKISNLSLKLSNKFFFLTFVRNTEKESKFGSQLSKIHDLPDQDFQNYLTIPFEALNSILETIKALVIFAYVYLLDAN